MWAAIGRGIFIASQWAFGSVLERWFGGEDENKSPNERIITKVIIGVIASLTVIFVFRMLFGKKSWNK